MILTGSCLCGAIRLTAPGPAGPVTACHCIQCRKTSGFHAASFDVDEAAVAWTGPAPATWTTPGGATRAFCPTCGSKLWFRTRDGSFSVEMGLLDAPTGGHLAEHIFTAFKSGAYDIADGVPHFPKEGTL